MWGNIILEVSFLTNFHTNFNNSRSDVLIHLIQWQYWWWFWFSYWWGLYFLLFLRIFKFRSLKFQPKIVTSYRPHGKWGDLLICAIPISWCINIISNSNFILKMIEWQAESSLFTLRVRGRQWYWIYKYDLKTVTDLVTIPKNVGRNKWCIYTPNDLLVSDDYLHILQLRVHNKWIKRYWSEFAEKTLKDYNFNLVSINLEKNIHAENQKIEFLKNENLAQINNISIGCNLIKKNYYNNLFFQKNYFLKNKLRGNLDKSFSSDIFVKMPLFSTTKFIKAYWNLLSNNLNFKFEACSNNYYLFNHGNVLEITRWTKRAQGTNNPCRLLKYPAGTKSLKLFGFRFNKNNFNVSNKPAASNNYLVLKQKRYKPLKLVTAKIKYIRNSETTRNSNSIKYSGKTILLNNSIFKNDDSNISLQYKLIKKNKQQIENTPSTLWKRLLRTKRTLVLPAHVNITAITNSYDVIHSWFIPGIGLKLDCVPGRATHHVLHIDNVGFYYGQCAEICGRYHHHMPIRMCALPFEHFLMWWHTFGLSKLLYVGTDQRRYVKDYNLRKYIW